MHPDFGSGALILACENAKSRREWMAVIGDCGRITWENALLGDSMIERLRNKGTELEAEHDEATRRDQEEALKLRAEKDAFESKEKRRMMTQQSVADAADAIKAKEDAIRSLAEAKATSMAKLQQQESEAQMLIEANKRAEEEAARLAEEKAQAADTMSEMEKQAALLEEQKALTELTLQETAADAKAREAEAQQRLREIQESGQGVDEQLDLERQRRRKAERKLEVASKSLGRLEHALTRLEGQQRADADANVKKLRSFFEKRAEDEKKKAALVETMKAAVLANKLYRRHKRTVSAEMNMNKNKNN